MQIIDHWVVPYWPDVILETSTLIAYLLFLVFLLVIMRKKYPLLKAKSITWIIVAAIIGVIASGMNVFDEFAWFTQFGYSMWKIIKSALFALSLVFMTYGFYLFQKLIKRLFE